MTDRIFATAGGWAVASDGIQWILQCRKGPNAWRGVSFVRSTRDILARCMREKGADVATARLFGLPHTFDQWKAAQASPQTPSMNSR